MVNEPEVERRRARFRQVMAGVAVAGMLPYLAIKVLWICGSDLGVRGMSMDDPAIVALNVATLAMETVAVVVALAMATRIGMRLPAWVVVFPVWVAAGLLVPRVTLKPLVSALVKTVRPVERPQPLERWVYLMVGAAFAVQGVALLLAFVSYCGSRWSAVLTRLAGAGDPGVNHGFALVAVRGAAGFAGTTWVLSIFAVVVADPADRAGLIGEGVSSFVWGLFALVGAFVLARQLGGGLRLLAAIAMVGVGTGSMVWWGVLGLVSRLSDAGIGDGVASPLGEIARLGQVCVGLVVAIVAAFTVAEAAGVGRPAIVATAKNDVARRMETADRM